ncbi:MAG: DEAD/DEAH box helicase [Candidatus Methanomethylophilaceae archaeon]|nr:DEAD/DEAH box helicase [Candidatus Methanomethylophilaceae archaeon]
MSLFSELGINKRLCKAIAEMGWSEPTPIQLQSIPVGMSGKDMFGQAQTGTGKTGAYAITAIGRTKSGSELPTTLIVVPTRELAEQVSNEIRALTKYTHHAVVTVYGGAPYADQVKGLKAGCDVVVGTPGRIIDLCGKGYLRFDAVKELVLDEADRMLDMGFIEDMDKIISMVSKHRQTLMFSATLSDDVRSVAERSMREPVEVSVSHDSLVPELVRQYYIEVKRNAKMDVLRDIMANGDPKMVVFCSTKKMVDDLYEGMSKEGVSIGAIHGDMPQNRRERTIRGFKANRMKMLVATDVAARGLDIDNIECVVNYDAPIDPESYTHRIGRAGRAGRTGVAITFVTPREDRRIPSYEEYMGKKIERVNRKQISKLQISNPELKAMHADESTKAAIRRIDAVARNATKGGHRAPRDADLTIIALDIPKDAGVSRTEIVGYVMKTSGVTEDKIGRIGIGNVSTFVEIDSAAASSVIRALNGTTFRERKVRAYPAPAKVKYKQKVKRRPLL